MFSIFSCVIFSQKNNNKALAQNLAMNSSLLTALTVLLTLAGHCGALETGTKVSMAKDSAIFEGPVVGDGSLTDQQNSITEASPTATLKRGLTVKYTAECLPLGSCRFDYDDASTPTLSSFTPTETSGGAGERTSWRSAAR